MVWRIDDPMGDESKKIVWEVAPYLRGRGLDIGAGNFKILPHAISVDDGSHMMLFGHRFKPDVTANAEKLDMFASQSMDFVFSSHTLEHIEDHKSALKEWWRLIKHGGKLVLYLPHKNFYPNIGQEGSNPDHKHDFLPQDIIDAMQEICGKDNQFDLLQCQERNEDYEYSMLLVFRKISGRNPQFSYRKPRPEKTCLICRFGAFGDLMQASSVFAGLKKQGYHVTLMTSLPGAEVISQDPHIDEIMLLDKDQIPNPDLGSFWKWQAKKYDKFVNLSESVEATFLAMPGRTQHNWSPVVRHTMLNRNYLEFQHMLAGVPHDPQVKFYATQDEQIWAKRQRGKMGQFVVVWSLSGSSVHKTWAGLDRVIGALMVNYKNVDVVLVGGPGDAILEAGWENERRVHKKCGQWSIRESLAFLAEADLVIGPETGVLNAVAHEDIPKIVFLSHSSHENLTRDWKNVAALQSKGTKCPGRGNDEVPACHMMHYNWEFCAKDENSGTAQCQVDIGIEEVYFEIERVVDMAQRQRLFA